MFELLAVPWLSGEMTQKVWTAPTHDGAVLVQQTRLLNS